MSAIGKDILERSSQSDSTINFADKYFIIKDLGKGSYGVVYSCEDKSSGQVFACKVLPKRGLNSSQCDKIRKEIDIMRKLPSHPNIVSLKEHLEDEDAFRLVMDLCAGGRLLAHLKKKGSYTDREAATMMMSIVEAVKFCHENGVIHRDLKLDNIMLVEDATESSEVKIIDFGLSESFTPGQTFTEDREKYGPKSDIWSLGSIMYTLLYGFRHDIEYVLKTRLINGLPINQETPPKISGDALDLLSKMLDTDASSRLTAEQVLEHPWMKAGGQAMLIPEDTSRLPRCNIG